MAKLQGRFGKLKISTDGGTTYSDVTGIADITMNANGAEIKVTTHDDGAFETYLSGRNDFSLECSAMYDPASTEQAAIIATRFATDPGVLYFKYMPKESAGIYALTCQGVITKCTPQ
jgi:predicted secreted protein